MTDFRINVIVDPGAAQPAIDKVNNQLERTSALADKTSARATKQVRGVNNQIAQTTKRADALRTTLSRLFIFVGIGASLRQLGKLAETFTLVQNRIRTVTDSTLELNAVTKELFEISNRTRGSFESTAEAYTRVRLATEELGTSQQETLNFTESLNQAVALSGATAMEAQAGLIQLSQGLGSGALRGDELRSVLEGLPVIADVIAKSLGATRSELKALGSEGALTAEVILKAFKEARGELSDRFKEAIPTVGQAFEVLRNNLIRFIGELDKSIGATSSFAQAILLAAENLDALVIGLGLASGALIIYANSTRLASSVQFVKNQLDFINAIKTGRAVALGSAEANKLRAVSLLAVTRSETALITQNVRRARSEVRLAETGLASANATRAQLIVERQIEIVRLQAQISDKGRQLSLTRLAEIRKAELAINTQQIAAENALTRARNTGIAADTARAGALEKVSRAQAGSNAATATAIERNNIFTRSLDAIKKRLLILSRLIATNPIAALGIAVVATIAALVAFSDEISIASGSLTTLEDLAVATAQIIGESLAPAFDLATAALSTFVDFFEDNFGFIATFAKEVFADIEFSIVGLLKVTAETIDSYLNLWLAGFNGTLAIFKNLPAALGEIFVNAFNVVIKVVENAINNRLRRLNTLSSLLGFEAIPEVDLGKLENNYSGAGERLGDALSAGITEGLQANIVSGALDTIVERANKISTQREAAKRKQARDEANALSKEGGGTTRVRADIKTILTRLKQETDLLSLSNKERAVQIELLKIEDELNRKLTESESALIKTALVNLQALENQDSAYQSIKGSQEDYLNTLESANALLDQGRISLGEYNRLLSETQLAQDVTDIQDDISQPGEDAIRQLEEELAARQVIIDQAIDARLLSETEGAEALVELQRKTAQEIKDIERARASEQFKAASGTFESLSGIAKTFAGEQSGIYKGLFAASKGFAIADSSVQIFNAIAKAANTPFPANLGAIATVAAQTANIVSSIQSIQMAGAFQNGGDFMVGGSGGTDSQTVSFQATPGEKVSVQTPQQQKTNESKSESGQAAEPNVSIINVLDPSLIENFFNTEEGDRILVNKIQSNAGSINTVLAG